MKLLRLFSDNLPAMFDQFQFLGSLVINKMYMQIQ